MIKPKLTLTTILLIFFFTISCNDSVKGPDENLLSGDWKLVSSTNTNIDFQKDYFIIFTADKIFSMHNQLGEFITDCENLNYTIEDSIMKLVHYDIDYALKFYLNKKSLTLSTGNNQYIFESADNAPDHESYAGTEGRHAMGELNNNNINEASGIITSQKNPGILYTHNDSGGEGRLFALNYQGENIAEIWLNNLELIDCEDISIMEINGRNYILLADMGDNRAVRDYVFIYIIPEPDIDQSLRNQSLSVGNIQKLTLQYSDGRRDAETLISLPNEEIMIITKREPEVRLYKTKITLNNSKTITPEYLGKIQFTNIVAGDLHLPSETLLIKNYESVFSVEFPDEAGIPNVYTAKTISYKPEPKGEAICWDLAGTGYFTLSEEQNNIEAVLYYYAYKPFWLD